MAEPVGDGGHTRTAVFVHGAGGGGWEWAVWARVFKAAGWDVMAHDLQPGREGLAATTLDDYTAQVGAWLDAVKGPCALVGASLGGRLAQRLAHRACALVLINPLPVRGQPEAAPSPAIIPWGRRASLAGTRRALPDSDDLAALWAFRRWRDESGQALDQARQPGDDTRPRCPVLVFASDQDDDVAATHSQVLADRWGARCLNWPGSHVGPLLGRQAAEAARQAVEWLNGLDGTQ